MRKLFSPHFIILIDFMLYSFLIFKNATLRSLTLFHWGRSGEVAQIMYTHASKCPNYKIIKRKKDCTEYRILSLKDKIIKNS
jgi:hypothetical protein